MIVCKNGKVTANQKWWFSNLLKWRPAVDYDGHGIGPFYGPELAKVRKHLEQSRASRTRYTKLLYWLDQHNEEIHAMTPEERYVLYYALGASPSVDSIRRQLYYLQQYAKKVE